VRAGVDSESINGRGNCEYSKIKYLSNMYGFNEIILSVPKPESVEAEGVKIPQNNEGGQVVIATEKFCVEM